MLNVEEKRLPVYELYFSKLFIFLSPADYELVQFAYVSSKYGHARQTRKDGSRYFDHPKAASIIYIDELGGRDPRIIIDILLHDISEDTRLLSPYRISLNFGEEIALDIRALTKLSKGKETNEEYFQRIVARGPQTITAKLCDRLHNIRSLDACPKENQVRKIEETQVLLQVFIPALKAFGGQYKKYAKILEHKMLEAIKALEL